MHTRLIRSVVLALALAGPARAAVTTGSIARDLYDLSRLPDFRSFAAHQFSSYDRTGGNGDAQHFLAFNGHTALLADMDGPGAVVRLWSANANSAGHLRIYLDGAPTPVVDAPFQDLFNGHVPPFVPPLSRVSSGGFISYVPIPFAHHCRITVDDPHGLYYHVTWVSYPKRTRVRSFRLPLRPADGQALQRAAEAWTHPGQAADRLKLGAARPLAPGRTLVLARLDGPAVVRALKLRVQGLPTAALRQLVLCATFDGHSTPDVEAPVADFFGNAYGGVELRSLLVGQTKGGFYCLAPMPFARSARFTLANRSARPVSVSFALNVRRQPFDPQREGRFHATFFQESTRRGMPHRWLRVTGERGHFVGETQCMSGHGLGFLEGDEQFRADAEHWLPSTVPTTVVGPWNGTGTEDYYNCGWYFDKGPIQMPPSGAVVREDAGHIAAYRWHLTDSPSFRHSLDAQIEHGGANDAPGTYYASVAFWYSNGENQPLAPLPSAAAIPELATTGQAR